MWSLLRPASGCLGAAAGLLSGGVVALTTPPLLLSPLPGRLTMPTVVTCCVRREHLVKSRVMNCGHSALQHLFVVVEPGFDCCTLRFLPSAPCLVSPQFLKLPPWPEACADWEYASPTVVYIRLSRKSRKRASSRENLWLLLPAISLIKLS